MRVTRPEARERPSPAAGRGEGQLLGDSTSPANNSGVVFVTV